MAGNKRKKLLSQRGNRKIITNARSAGLRPFFAEEMHDYGIDIRNFSIYLTPIDVSYDDDSENLAEPGVEYQMSTRFIKNLHILSSKNPRSPILIHMKSCGGSWEEGMAIFDSIRACPNQVTILSYTHARSMSSIILQAADKRVLMPHSHFLFHEGDMHDGGTAKQFLSSAEWYKKLHPVMLGIYSSKMKRVGKFSNWSIKRIEEMLQEQMDKKEDVYLTAQETVDWGLADEVFGADGNFDWVALRKY